jgi:hypothetical protein
MNPTREINRNKSQFSGGTSGLGNHSLAVNVFHIRGGYHGYQCVGLLDGSTRAAHEVLMTMHKHITYQK